MLTAQENDLLTRVGPGTPMGGLLRRFWLPVMMAEELPAPDCAPVRVHVLGEDLVAFKDSRGRIGLLDRRCPHRHADLFWGRNEKGGLRCVYHGWKYDTDGNCLDIPNTPEGATYKEKITTFAAYPAREAGGVVWAYMGPKKNMPPLPDLEWLRVPAENRHVLKVLIQGNYLQAMEGDMDSSHVSFLHSRIDGGRTGEALGARLQDSIFRDTAPHWVIKDTEYGLMLAAQRDGGNGTVYWRVNQWLMPSFTMIATKAGTPVLLQVRVPRDDETTLFFRVWWHPSRPLTDAERHTATKEGVFFPELIPGTYRAKENKENDYLIDRELQRRYSYTGIKSIPAQDWAVQEDQGGSIMDRSLEHLVSADSAIINMRRRLLTTVRDLQEGVEPTQPQASDAYKVRPIDIVLDKGIPVWEGAEAYLTAKAW